jgi:hypothetical protein
MKIIKYNILKAKNSMINLFRIKTKFKVFLFNKKNNKTKNNTNILEFVGDANPIN